jgi:hypothetical protein
MATRNRNVGSGFHVHQTMLGSARNSFGSKKVSLGQINKVVARVLSYDAVQNGLNAAEVLNSPNFRRYVIEHGMEGTAPVIFPESIALVEQMVRSKFNFQKSIDLALPFNSFTLSMPKGIIHDNKELRSIAVRLDNDAEDIKSIASTFIKDIQAVSKEDGYDYFDSDHLDALAEKPFNDVGALNSDVSMISLMVEYDQVGVKNDPDFTEYKLRSDLLSLALKSNKREDFVSLCKLYDEDASNQHCVDSAFSLKRRGEILYFGIKALASLVVYMSLDDNKLQEGLPSKFTKDKYNLHKKTLDSSPYLLKSTPSIERGFSAKGAHYRQSHFRNLRDERFYRGEHEGKEVGSRWVAVSDSLVNSHSDPFTLTR